MVLNHIEPHYEDRVGSAFDLKDQSGVTIEFKRDASGKVTEAALNDNGTAIVLKKKQQDR